MRAIRAQGPGGQHVNKSSSAIQLIFAIRSSSLAKPIQQRLLGQSRQQAQTGLIVIKAQRFRSLERNRQDALERLAAMIRAAARPARKRKATRPSRRAKEKRLKGKARRGQLKEQRRKVF